MKSSRRSAIVLIIIVVIIVVVAAPGCIDTANYANGGREADAGDASSDDDDARLSDGGDEASATDAAVDAVGSDATIDSASGSAYALAVLADSPVGYWRLGEATGAIAADQIGKTVGTYVSVKLAVAGATNDGDTAADFKDSQVRLGQGFAFSQKKPFSCEAWILPRTIDTSYRRFLGRKVLASPRQGYSFGVHSPEGIYFDRWVDDGAVDTTLPFPTTPGFHHIVGTYDGLVTRLYVDGALAAGPAPDTRLMPDHTADQLIGAGQTTGEQPFDGVIDEVAIYDVALLATRVKAHFDAAKQ